VATVDLYYILQQLLNNTLQLISTNTHYIIYTRGVQPLAVASRITLIYMKYGRQ